jgi:hypothetical protein
VFPLVKPTSDHLPCVVSIGTKIPRAKIFRFENYWLQHSSFKDIFQNAWAIPVGYSCSAKRINAKFKNLRRAISIWARNLPCLKKQIDQVNSVIEMLDIFEETRPLNSHEWNLRDLLKSFIITLLQNQKYYWKQRGKIKWVKLGDANTKFFHSKASISYRHNYISMLKNIEGAEISDHEGKEEILWSAFKERMGTLDNVAMHFNLSNLFGTSEYPDILQALEAPFSDTEIDNVIKHLPNDKSHGPDGFNNEFIKSYWHIIGNDIKELIKDFYNEKISLESINSSFHNSSSQSRYSFFSK